ncbi:putative transporter YycB [Alcanivorax sp. ALC70]|nr:putative transporter YycB [Alcanivorax sp. ALC70]
MTTPTPAPLPRRALAGMITVAVLVGLNLRPSMAAVGPLADRIQAALGASYTGLALLTTLPVLAMAAGCFLGAGLARRLGDPALVVASLLMILLADLARLANQTLAGLMLTALVAGFGIAFLQVRLPALIKRRAGGYTALVMGWYIAAVMGGAALASSLAPPLATLAGGWRAGLAVWAALAVLALLAWWRGRAVFGAPPVQGATVPTAGLWRRPRTWTLALFFGLGTAGYTCVLAWLPPYYVARGFSPSQAGGLLGFLTAMEVVAGLLLPPLVLKSADRRPALLAVLASALAGFVLLAGWPLGSPLLVATLLGLGIGGLFPLSLIVAMDHHDNAEVAGALAGIVQGIGYLIAAFSPFLAGVIRDRLGDFALAWIGLAALYVLLIAMALRFNPRRYARHYPLRLATDQV